MNAFLAAKTRSADAAYGRRPDAGTRPLIEASEAFPAMEALALGARAELCIGLRIFDPDTRLRSDEARQLGLRTWGDLIAHLTANGVSVRLLLTDFEPVAARALHEMTWNAVRGFSDCVRKAGGEDRFQAIAALHAGEFGWLVRLGFWPLLKAKAERISARLGRAGRVDFQSWRLLRQRGGQPGRALSGPPRMWPATYHQKFMVADGARAIIGGLDVDERRYDDPDHGRPPDRTWHDVSFEVAGEIAADIRDHFDRCWNFEVPRFNARLTRMGAPAPGIVRPVGRRPASSQVEPAAGQSSLRLIRTRSRRSRSWLSIGPRPDITEIEAAHLAQIESARSCLYLETQFLRSRQVTDAMVTAGEANPDLHLIVLLPAAPDEAVFDGESGMGLRHGEWLQVRALDRIRAAFADRCGFFCLTRGEPGTETGERDAVAGDEIAYVHAKVAVADARTAIVSSANLNGRSLRWDTEAGLFWDNAGDVAAFQAALWKQHLRRDFDESAAGSVASALAMWRDAADKDPAGDDCAQVSPYPLEKARNFARYSPLVPHDMV
jgi:phosphatidylserine/phosphatidylglycerophosphate/cardiolipin synthase-like enzyme